MIDKNIGLKFDDLEIKEFKAHFIIGEK